MPLLASVLHQSCRKEVSWLHHNTLAVPCAAGDGDGMAMISRPPGCHQCVHAGDYQPDLGRTPMAAADPEVKNGAQPTEPGQKDEQQPEKKKGWFNF